MAKKSFKEIISPQIKKLVVWLRYRNTKLIKPGYIYSSYSEIASAVGLKYWQVVSICKESRNIQERRLQGSKKRESKVKEIHKNYILDDKTLEKHKHLSLAGRCIQIHRQFPEIKLSSSALRLLYHQNGVTYKIMKSKKLHTNKQEDKIEVARKVCFQALLRSYDANDTIVYLDETIFQPHSVMLKSWAKRNQNQVMYKQSITIKTISAAVCINAKSGLLTYILRERSIRSLELIKLVQSLREALGHERAIIFLDNLRCHHSKIFLKEVQDQNFKVLFNAAYSPEYHCIEEVFSSIKLKYKKMLIERNFKVSDLTHIQIIRQCIESAQREAIEKTERRHINKMKEYLSKLV